MLVTKKSRANKIPLTSTVSEISETGWVYKNKTAWIDTTISEEITTDRVQHKYSTFRMISLEKTQFN